MIKAQGMTFACSEGANLRRVLLQQGVDVHNAGAKIINCRGLGTCGTCAVEIEGAVSEPEWREQARLSLPPHSLERKRRLSCQTKVMGDLLVTKYDGFWGQGDQVIWNPDGQFSPST